MYFMFGYLQQPVTYPQVRDKDFQIQFQINISPFFVFSAEELEELDKLKLVFEEDYLAESPRVLETAGMNQSALKNTFTFFSCFISV